MENFGWIQVGELLGQLVALVFVVVIFLKFMERMAEAERKRTAGYIDELGNIGKDCHTMSRENQKLFQDQLAVLIQQGHDDSVRITNTLAELTLEIKTMNHR